MKLSCICITALCFLLSGTALASGIVIIENRGTCGDGTQVVGRGSGTDQIQASANANKQIIVQCASRGLVASYDSSVIIRDTRP